MAGQDPDSAPFTSLERPEPIICVDAVEWVRFDRRDVDVMDRFLKDFGLLATDSDGDVHYYRGYGSAPWLVSIAPAAQDRFAGLGVRVATLEALERLAAATELPIEAATGPGGGRRVALTDPDGLAVDVVYGAREVAPLPTRDTLESVNTPALKPRVNRGIRTPLEPAPVFKLGHVVLQRRDFGRAADWYMRHLGVIPSDVQYVEGGATGIAFFRLDRGAEPADHHSIAIANGPNDGLMHVSFESFDIESVGLGHQHLRAQGWTHYWGTGRHMLGSQFFDYWKDPAGDEWEHYADGDVMDASYPTGYHPFSRGTLWAWGHDLPDTMRPDLAIEDIDKIHASGAFGAMELETARSLMTALLIPPRPWMR